MQQLSTMDATMIYLEAPRAPNTLNTALTYDPSTSPAGVVSFDDVVGHLERRLHLARSFRQRLARVPMDLDDPYWIEDPDFDLEFHVRQIALPSPGNWKQLCTQIARIADRPLDMTRPLWELYMIEGLDSVEALPPGSFALLLKIHHACIDGVSGAEMLDALSDPSPDAQPPEPDRMWNPESPPSSLSLLQRAAVHSVTRPLNIARLAVRSVPALGELRPRRRPDGDDALPGLAVPRTRFNGPVSGHRVLDARWFPLETARRMRSGADGATINDVALAVVGGALRAYLSDKGELPADGLISLVPVSIRAPEEAGAGGNRITMMRVPLFTNLADPVQRLAAVVSITRKLKEQNQAVSARTLTQISEQLPGRLVGAAQRSTMNLAMRAGRAMGTNTTVTNVPGSQTPLYFAGARLVRSFGAAPLLNGSGLIHPIGSYCGEMAFLFTADRQMIPDPDFYAGCIEEAFMELATATQ